MKRWFALLVAVTVLGQGIFTGGRVLLSYRVLDMGGDAVTVGMLTAAFSLVPLLIALRAGRLVDDGSAPAVMRAGLVATVAATAVMAWSQGLPTLAVGYIALGFAHMTTLVAAQGMVSHLRGSTKALDSLFAYFTLGISVGQLLGIVFSGWIASMGQRDAAGGVGGVGGGVGGVGGGEVGGGGGVGVGVGGGVPEALVSVDTTPALIGLTVLGVVTLVLGWPVAGRYRDLLAEPRNATGGPVAHIPVTRMLTLPGMPAAMAASISVIVAIDLITAYMPVLGAEIGLSVGEVTAILAARSGAAVLARAVMPIVLRTADRDRVLVTALAAGAIPLLAVPWLESAWMLFAAMAVCGVAWGFVMPMTMTWVSSLVPSADKAMALSVRLMGNRLAQVVLPAAAGAMAMATGVAAVFAVSGAVLGVSAVGAAGNDRRERRDSGEPGEHGQPGASGKPGGASADEHGK